MSRWANYHSTRKLLLSPVSCPPRSRQHFHDQERYAYVISGTWWVSSSNVYDPSKTYPVHAGTVAIDRANTVHWDGARAGEKEPAILELVGIGPVKTIQVDEQGKPLPPAPAR